MSQRETPVQFDILLVEDSPSDAMMAREALERSGVPHVLHVVTDGMEAMAFLRRQGGYSQAPRPCLIYLDLNLPRKSGREVLAEIKADADLSNIPVVVLTTSRADDDVIASYRLHANCYVAKPVDFLQFADAICCTQRFWFEVAMLPPEVRP